jgi:catechol 2,3-dioxygenase-like lactoylglutathione lyase family enzyme
MLHHVSIGVLNVERAARFYDSVLGALGYRRVMEVLPYGIGYGESKPVFWVQLPHDQGAATVGNGVHFGFVAATKDAVIAFHGAALAAGGTDEGAPGPRPDYGPDYYGAFVRDLDGHKLEAILTPKPAAATAATNAKAGKAKTKTKKKTSKRKAANKASGKKGKKRKAAKRTR